MYGVTLIIYYFDFTVYFPSLASILPYISFFYYYSSVSDPHRFFADPDPDPT